MSADQAETIATLRAAREWIEKATDNLRPFGTGACAEGEAMLRRIDYVLADAPSPTPTPKRGGGNSGDRFVKIST